MKSTLRFRFLKFFEYLESLYWERKLGIKARFRIPVEELSVRHDDVIYARPYEPVPYGTLFAALRLSGIGDASSWNFVDYGCGAGRAVIGAAYYGFRRCRGYDLDEALIARANGNKKGYFQRTNGRKDIRFICETVLNCEMEEGPTVHYLYNPFDSNVLLPLMRKLEENGCFERGDLVIYVNPIREHVMDLFGLVRVKHLRHWNHNRNIAVFFGAGKGRGADDSVVRPDVGVHDVPQIDSGDHGPFQ